MLNIVRICHNCFEFNDFMVEAGYVKQTESLLAILHLGG